MKKMVKSGFIALLCCMPFAACMADTEVSITVDQLPAAAQATINQYFNDLTIASVTKEVEEKERDTEYIVFFTNTTKIKFDYQGQWEKIECRVTEVPRMLVPSMIDEKVSNRFPGQFIYAIEQDFGGYEVKLSNGVELKFNSSYQLVDVDR